MLDRFAIAAALREIAALLRMTGGARFRSLAFETAATTLESIRADANLLGDPQRLLDLPGIGPRIANVVEELHRTSSSRLLSNLRSALPPGALQLIQVPHVTIARIRKLHEALGIDSVDALEAAARDGRVRTVRGFGPVVVDKLLAGIAAWRTRSEAFLLPRATKEAQSLRAFVAEFEGVVGCEIAGGIRRSLEVMDLIEVVAVGAESRRILDHVAAYPASTGVVERTTDECELRLASGLRARVTMSDAAAFGSRLFERTGDPGHVERVRDRLAARGHGPDDAFGSETELYEAAGMGFVPPELREDAGEVHAAIVGALPAPLVTVADIRGLVHCHTVDSDGRHTIERMAKAADAMGMEYLTITDHSRSAGYAHGLEIERLQRQWDEIDRVQASVHVRLLKGTESDILRDGSLDYPDDVLARLDIVIASIHERHRLDRRQMTQRLVNAMEHPLFKVWGHPLGRYVRSRPPIDCDVEAVLQAAASHRVAIEINGDPHRLDLEPFWIRKARAAGIPFVVSTDAHSIRQYANLEYGVAMARRGWLTPDHVLNTRDAAAFAAAVRPAR